MILLWYTLRREKKKYWVYSIKCCELWVTNILFQYVRMSQEKFDHLILLVQDKICKRDTGLREAIAPVEGLAVDSDF